MTKTNKDKLRRLGGIAAKAFILASVAAMVLPMPRYAHSLSDEQYVVWVARLSWVLLLSVGFVGVLLLVSSLARQLQKKN